MQKMRANRKLRHGRSVVEEGDEFDCSEVDANYYLSHKMADAVEKEPPPEKKPRGRPANVPYATRRMTSSPAAPEPTVEESSTEVPTPEDSAAKSDPATE